MLKQYNLTLLLLVIISAIIIYTSSLFLHNPDLINFGWGTLFYSAFISWITGVIAIPGANSKQHNQFLMHVFGMMGIKFLFYLIWFFGYFFLFKPEGYYFVIPFFLLYMIFTIFETVFLVKAAFRLNTKDE